jgi:hypothetical protein
MKKATVWSGKLWLKKSRKMLIENRKLRNKYWGKFMQNSSEGSKMLKTCHGKYCHFLMETL